MLNSFYYRIGRYNMQNGFSHSSTFLQVSKVEELKNELFFKKIP